MSFDTKPKLFESAVQSGDIRKRNHLNTHPFIRNKEDTGIRKQSHSISVSKRAQAKDMRMDKYGVMEAPTLSF